MLFNENERLVDDEELSRNEFEIISLNTNDNKTNISELGSNFSLESESSINLFRKINGLDLLHKGSILIKLTPKWNMSNNYIFKLSNDNLNITYQHFKRKNK